MAIHFAGLLFCNAMWALTYSVGKILMSKGYKPLEVTFLRHLFALVPLLIFIFFSRRNTPFKNLKFQKSDLFIAAIGLFTFFFCPLFQMNGLNMTRAVDSALLIAMEPLSTILLAVVFFKERLKLIQIISIAIAIAGCFILTDATLAMLLAFTDQRLVGNVFFILSTIFESFYTIFSKPVLKVRSATTILAGSLFFAVILLFIFNGMQNGFHRNAGITPLFTPFNLDEFGMFVFLGTGCTAFGYVYWLELMKVLPVSWMAITLYSQPVFGVFWGNLLLNEEVSRSTLVGGTMIMCAVLLSQFRQKTK